MFNNFHSEARRRCFAVVQEAGAPAEVEDQVLQFRMNVDGIKRVKEVVDAFDDVVVEGCEFVGDVDAEHLELRVRISDGDSFYWGGTIFIIGDSSLASD